MGIARLPGGTLHRRIDIKLYPADEFAFALLYFTGSDHFNRSMCWHAKRYGYTLSGECGAVGKGASRRLYHQIATAAAAAAAITTILPRTHPRSWSS